MTSPSVEVRFDDGREREMTAATLSLGTEEYRWSAEGDEAWNGR
jgi:hypothetical protein